MASTQSSGAPKTIIGGVVVVVVAIVIAIVIMAIASYTLAQINSSNDDVGYDCKWTDSDSLSSLHVKLSWIISLSVIAVVFVIIGTIAVGGIAIYMKSKKANAVAVKAL
jgi:hypothetical protein